MVNEISYHSLIRTTKFVGFLFEDLHTAFFEVEGYFDIFWLIFEDEIFGRGEKIINFLHVTVGTLIDFIFS